MKILVTRNGIIKGSASGFLFGAWEERDIKDGVTVHKWKSMNDEGNLTGYVLDDDALAIYGMAEPSFQVFDIEAFPDDYVSGKYLFVGGAFVKNPDYVPPEPTPEEKIAALEAKNAELEAKNAEFEVKIAMQNEAMNELFTVILPELYPVLE